MDLSVIIVNYNVRHYLEICLQTVIKASESTECEIFVVDNNSSDDSCEMVSKRFPVVKLISNKENKGFAAANNQALKLCSGKHILLLNPDTLVEEDIFKKCMMFMENHKDAGAVGVKMINGKGKLVPESKRAFPAPRTAFYKITGLSYLFPKSKIFNSYYLGHLDSNAVAKADVLSGAFMFLKREAFLSTGFLDEAYFMHGEDIDYSFKLKNAGFSNYYFPSGRIIHFKGQSTDKDDFKNISYFFKSILIFAAKNSNGYSKRIMILPVYSAILLRSLLSVIRRATLWLLSPMFKLLHNREERTAVIADQEGYEKIKQLLSNSPVKYFPVGRISVNSTGNSNNTIGNIDEITNILKKNKINELIISIRILDIARVIDYMQLVSNSGLKIRFASVGEEFIIGTGFVLYN